MPSTQPDHRNSFDHPRNGPLQKTVDAGLLVILLVAPLCMGGRHPFGECVFVALVTLVTIIWLIGQCKERNSAFRRSGVEGLLVAGLGLVALQLVALPESVLAMLSPGFSSLFPLWHVDSSFAGQSSWSTVSVAPQETLSGLSVFAAYAMLFTVLVQRLRAIEDAEQVLKWIAIATVGMTGIGLAQYFAGNGRFLWVYEHPFRTSSSTVMGTFQNRNHFAHFLALGIGPLIWWLWTQCQPKKRTESRQWGSRSESSAIGQFALPLLLIALGLTGIAVIFSLSRAGIAVYGGATFVCAAVLCLKSLIDRKVMIAVTAVVLLTGVGAGIYGTTSLEAKLETITQAESLRDVSSGRLQIWNAVTRGIPDFIGLGSGVGTHRFVYPRYIEGDHRVEYSHAENGYLQVLLETGVVGFTLLCFGLLACCYWCVRAYRNAPCERHAACVAAVAAGIAASIVHSLGDFVWYVPACMSMTIFLVAIAWRLSRPVSQSTSDKMIVLPRFVWGGAVVAMCGVFYVTLGIHLPPAMANAHWDSFHRLSLSSGNNEFVHSPDTLDQRLEELEALLAIDGTNAKAHLNLSSLLRIKFDVEQSKSSIPMPLAQIRDAALSSPFPDRASLDQWLQKILGDRKSFLDRSLAHALAAVKLCPFQGEAYIFMSELNFLRETNRDREVALIDQALRTRPVAPPVLISAGREALLAGDEEKGLEHFKKAFTLGGAYQQLVIQALGRQDAEFFFKTFALDTNGMLSLRNHYAAMGNDEQSRITGTRFARALVEQATSESGAEAAATWSRAQEAFAFLKDDDNSLQAAKNAVASAKYDYSYRRKLVTLLVAQKKFEEAVPLLEWCLKQYPENGELKKTLMMARSQVQQASFTTESGQPR